MKSDPVHVTHLHLLNPPCWTCYIQRDVQEKNPNSLYRSLKVFECYKHGCDRTMEPVHEWNKCPPATWKQEPVVVHF